MSNSISFSGRLGGDPESKDVGDTQLLTFTVANNTGYGDKENTNWFRCNIWGKRGQAIKNFLSKGSQVCIHGELSLRAYTNKEGVEKTSAEIRVSDLDFVGSKADSGTTAPSPAAVASGGEDEAPF